MVIELSGFHCDGGGIRERWHAQALERAFFPGLTCCHAWAQLQKSKAGHLTCLNRLGTLKSSCERDFFL